MDRGTIFRGAIVVTLIGAAGLTGFWLLQRIDVSVNQVTLSALFDVTKSIIAALAVGFAVVNYRAVLSFIRRSLTSTDELVIHKWFVYRITKAAMSTILLKDAWVVRRNLSRNYVVDMLPLNRIKRNAYNGEVVCNERDRFNILLKGKLHEEQSLICFIPRIGTSSDTRMLGLAVGDDADYVLSSRVYLASRKELPDELATAILNDAIEMIRKEDDPLIQLTQQGCIAILGRHKVPSVAPIEAPVRGIMLRTVYAWRAALRPSQGSPGLPGEILAMPGSTGQLSAPPGVPAAEVGGTEPGLRPTVTEAG